MTHGRLRLFGVLILTGFAVVAADQEPSAPRASAATAYSGWPAYGGGPEQIRYSSLSEVSRSGRLPGDSAAQGHVERNQLEHGRARVEDPARRIS